jgi:RNA polymerase sigma-70 factor, ECF subfamily
MPPDERRQRFETYARTVWVPLHAYVSRRAHPADVDDAVADTLTVAWRRLDDIPVDNPIPWTLGVGRRTLANQRRGNRRREALDTRLHAQPVPATAHERDGDPALDAALVLLPADDREILHLWAWEQLEPRDLAVVLGISPNTAAARFSRAKKRLANVLARHDRRPAGHEQGGAPKGPQS